MTEEANQQIARLETAIAEARQSAIRAHREIESTKSDTPAYQHEEADLLTVTGVIGRKVEKLDRAHRAVIRVMEVRRHAVFAT